MRCQAFFTVDEIRQEIHRCQFIGETIQKYVPTEEERQDIIRYAEQFDYPGMVILEPAEGVHNIVCGSVYDYRNGEIYEIFAVFNAEAMFGEKLFEEDPDFLLSISLGPYCEVQVPIRHAYLRHIFWANEFLEIADYLEQAEEQLEDFLEYLDENEDDDDDTSYVYHQ